MYQMIHVISSDKNQKGINAGQWCSVEKQKGIIAIDFLQW